MDQAPELRVRMFLDVRRAAGDTSSETEIVRRFAQRFKAQDWPGQQLPKVYYDPRSLETDPALRASLHAKCVVIDEEIAFVSSANFTEAAHRRNIEVGVLIRSEEFSRHLHQHFESLADGGVLKPVPLG
jgi:phosphatidylserine/phosphatidylglycerophosphate/cardiolipin synthase-like enzyme